ncbi:uncharacterized protein TNCV_1450881 [Trichonephila clavipes]|nr:uncharacterized protein TNCV_1450881 [Trichonephila clavipes]
MIQLDSGMKDARHRDGAGKIMILFKGQCHTIHLPMSGVQLTIATACTCAVQSKTATAIHALRKFSLSLDGFEKQMMDNVEFETMTTVVAGLKPVKIGLGKLCSRNVTLITAEGVFYFVIGELNKQNSEFAKNIKYSLIQRINERRNVNSIELMQYLNFGRKYEADVVTVDISKLPGKNCLRGRHNKEDQFDPEKAEKGTIVRTSRSEQDQATRMPDEEVINNGKTRKGDERVQRNPCHWRSWVTDPEVYKKLTCTKNGAKEKM